MLCQDLGHFCNLACRSEVLAKAQPSVTGIPYLHEIKLNHSGNVQHPSDAGPQCSRPFNLDMEISAQLTSSMKWKHTLVSIDVLIRCEMRMRTRP